MNLSFGAGVAILAHREKFEIEYEIVNTLMVQISDQSTAVSSLHGDLSNSFEKVTGGDLQKLSDATELRKRLTVTKNLVDQVSAEIGKLSHLQAECRAALSRAEAALPDYAKFVTNGRLDVVPGRAFFVAGKEATERGAHRFELSAPKQSIPTASLFDTQLSHRFSRS
jgi:hypothetical protein